MTITPEQIKALTVPDIQSGFKGWELLDMSPTLSEYYHEEWGALAHLSHTKNVIYYDLISGGNPHFNENYRCCSEFGKPEISKMAQSGQLDADIVLQKLVEWVEENLKSHGLPTDAARYETQSVYAEGPLVWFAGSVVADFTSQETAPASFEEVKNRCLLHVKTLQQAVFPLVKQTDIRSEGEVGKYAKVKSSNGFHSSKFVGKRGYAVGKLTSAGLKWVLRFPSESAINDEGLFCDDELEWDKT